VPFRGLVDDVAPRNGTAPQAVPYSARNLYTHGQFFCSPSFFLYS